MLASINFLIDFTNANSVTYAWTVTLLATLQGSNTRSLGSVHDFMYWTY